MTSSPKGLSASNLRHFAMAIMLIDHIGYVLFPEHLWLRYIGRLAFPIFAFLSIEGYHHTKNFGMYLGRLLATALITDLPYQFMATQNWDYLPFKNVIWTFLIGLVAIFLIDRSKPLINQHLHYLTSAAIFLIAYQLAEVLDTDYSGMGITMMLGFYAFRGRKTPQKMGQALIMVVANIILANLTLLEAIPLETLRSYWSQYGLLLLSPQYAATLALPIIWAYSGQAGYQSKPLQTFSYLFYPLHMVLLGLIALSFG